MGREVHRVPANWEHPRDDGYYRPLYDQTFDDAMQEWLDEFERFKVDPGREGAATFANFCEWHNKPPDPDYYHPIFDSEPTHYQIYETVSEGTPISPVFISLDQMITWLIRQGYSEHAAREFANHGYAFSMLIQNGEVYMDINTYDALNEED